MIIDDVKRAYRVRPGYWFAPIVLLAALLAISAAKTDGGWRWRWGPDS